MITEKASISISEAAVIAGISVRDMNRVIDEKILPADLYEGRRIRPPACTLARFYFETAEDLTVPTRQRAIYHMHDIVLKEYKAHTDKLLKSECLQVTTTNWDSVLEHQLDEYNKWESASNLSNQREFNQYDLDLAIIFSLSYEVNIENCRITWPIEDHEKWVFKDKFGTIDFSIYENETRHQAKRLLDARNAIVHDKDILNGEPVFKGTRVPVRDIAASLSKGISQGRILKAYPSLNGNEDLLDLAKIYVEAYPQRGRPKSLASNVTALKQVKHKIVQRRN